MDQAKEYFSKRAKDSAYFFVTLEKNRLYILLDLELKPATRKLVQDRLHELEKV